MSLAYDVTAARCLAGTLRRRDSTSEDAACAESPQERANTLGRAAHRLHGFTQLRFRATQGIAPVAHLVAMGDLHDRGVMAGSRRVVAHGRLSDGAVARET